MKRTMCLASCRHPKFEYPKFLSQVLDRSPMMIMSTTLLKCYFISLTLQEFGFSKPINHIPNRISPNNPKAQISNKPSKPKHKPSNPEKPKKPRYPLRTSVSVSYKCPTPVRDLQGSVHAA